MPQLQQSANQYSSMGLIWVENQIKNAPQVGLQMWNKMKCYLGLIKDNLRWKLELMGPDV